MDVHKVYSIFENWFSCQGGMRKMVIRSGMTPGMIVLDVGGSELNLGIFPGSTQLTLLNIDPQPDIRMGNLVLGDGCRLPFTDNAFDLVFSNSVIEHVTDQRAFASEVARVGRKFYVQTPNKWFPVEPHLLTPLVHWLPYGWRRAMLRHFTVWGLITKPSKEYVDFFMSTCHLLTPRKVRRLFPGADLETERVLGLTKSIVVWGG